MARDQQLMQTTSDIIGDLLDASVRGGVSVPREEFAREASVSGFRNQLFDKLVQNSADIFLLCVHTGKVSNDARALEQVCSNVLEATIGAWANEMRVRMSRAEEDSCYELKETYAGMMDDLAEWRAGRIPRSYEDRRGGYGGRDRERDYRDDRRSGESDPFFNSRRSGGGSRAGNGGSSFTEARAGMQQFGSAPVAEKQVAPVMRRGSDIGFTDPVYRDMTVVPGSAAESVTSDCNAELRNLPVSEAMKYPPQDPDNPHPTAFDPFVETIVPVVVLGNDNKKVRYFKFESIKEGDMEQARHNLAATFGTDHLSRELPAGSIQAIRKAINDNQERIIDVVEESNGGRPREPEKPRFLENFNEPTQALEFGLDSVWGYRRAEYEQKRLLVPTLDVYVRSSLLLELVKFTSIDQVELLNAMAESTTLERLGFYYKKLMSKEVGLPMLSRTIINKRLTDITNLALRVNVGLPKMRIEYFESDFEEVEAHICASYGLSIGNAFLKYFNRKVAQAVTVFGTDNRSVFLDALGYESDNVPELNALCTEVRTAVISLNSNELGFAFQAGTPTLVIREKTPLLFNLAITIMKNYRENVRYVLETADGYRFELSKSWLNPHEQVLIVDI